MSENTGLYINQVTVGLSHGKDILHGIDIILPPGECHVIVGPNGAGKSSLLHAIMGLSPYELRAGALYLHGDEIHNTSVTHRANQGLFMSFQSPIAIPGVTTLAFYKAIVQQYRHHRGLGPMPIGDLMVLIKDACHTVGLAETFLRRDVNDDFSGGERKRNELLQMLLLQPSVVMLDEIDSGVDIDAMANFSLIIKKQREKSRTSFLIVTHYHRFLDTLDVDAIHVILAGSKVVTGGKELMREIDAHGFRAWA